MDLIEPKIVALVCNWCTYTAADLAGTSRLPYPANVRMIRLMCTGMIDSKYILKAFLDGADGVFIGGCHPGDCHYINGNLKARTRISGVSKILEQFGFEPERLRLQWIGASEGPEFQRSMTDFVEAVRNLGPSQVQDRMII
ncbi:MAG: hydrogenase iron-sulfur subunit [Proteobacteria bacterium]|nr:hydrogenase iron-sulfur subunit [Pseudomonadota bacterium]